MRRRGQGPPQSAETLFGDSSTPALGLRYGGGSAPSLALRMDPAGINSFDAVIAALALITAVMGFMTGLMRALATILAYLAAAPVALVVTPYAAALFASQTNMAEVNRGMVFGTVFVVGGILLGALMRAAVTALFGPTASFTDRCAGALLGVVRIGCAAVLVVLVFDRVIPRHLEPDFLSQSRLRPLLSAAAAKGVRSLPPQATDLIDRLKRERGLI
jgi:membrane protein required for colicin V production